MTRIKANTLNHYDLESLEEHYPPQYHEAYLSHWHRHKVDDLLQTGATVRDVFGRELMVGDVVVKAGLLGRSAHLETGCVRQIKNGKVYIAKTPMNYSDRVCIIHRADGSVPEMPIEV